MKFKFVPISDKKHLCPGFPTGYHVQSLNGHNVGWFSPLFEGLNSKQELELTVKVLMNEQPDVPKVTGWQVSYKNPKGFWLSEDINTPNIDAAQEEASKIVEKWREENVVRNSN